MLVLLSRQSAAAILRIHPLNKKTNIMGRGDIKTKKGKITKASFGNIRPAKPARAKKAAAAAAAAAAPKKED
ncbi:MAG: 30S ribosomal protein THX [Chitinophagaceae bacterium]